MRVTVIPRTEEINEIKGKTAVIIDVLRATTSMVIALANGAKQIIPFLTPREAKDYATRAGDFLLCGERKGVKLPHFDLGNSPREFTKERVENKTLLMTTTNGTRAINQSLTAKRIFIASALNVQALMERIGSEKDLVIVCAGTKGKFSLDDFAVAGLIISYLEKNNDIVLDDLGAAAKMLLKDRTLYSLLAASRHGERLKHLGFQEDVAFCSQEGVINLVPYYDAGVIKI